MSRRPPDRPALDELLTGHGEADEWAALVASPGASSAWSAAVDRRSRLDRLAATLAGHPWLSEEVLSLRRASRRAPTPVLPTVQVQVRESALSALLDVGPPPARVVAVPWGGVDVAELAAGEEVHFDDPQVATVLYRTADTEGMLTAGWEMVSGEAPVLLALVAGLARDLAVARAGALPIAMLILIERQRGKTER
jgi:hypothetical protein